MEYILKGNRQGFDLIGLRREDHPNKSDTQTPGVMYSFFYDKNDVCKAVILTSLLVENPNE